MTLSTFSKSLEAFLTPVCILLLEVLMILLGRFIYIQEGLSKSASCTTVINYTLNSDGTTNDAVIMLLESACVNVTGYISSCIWEVVFMSSVFYAFLCWDMASDRVYWKDAIYIPLTAISIPIIIWLFNYIYDKYYYNNNNSNKKGVSKSEIISTVSNSIHINNNNVNKYSDSSGYVYLFIENGNENYYVYQNSKLTLL